MVRRATPSVVDPAYCPICGGGNECVKVTGKQGPCWCVDRRFNFDVLARAGTGKACICQRCLDRYVEADDESAPG